MSFHPKTRFSFVPSFILISILILLSGTLSLSLSLSLTAEEKVPFTPADSLRVRSFSPVSLTKDGHFIAGFIGMHLDRLGIDQWRHGDPTYIMPNLSDAAVLDTETGKLQPLFETKKQVRNLVWSPDGTILAFFLREGEGFVLRTYNRKTQKHKEIRLKTRKQIASNSFLQWTKDGSSLLLALRESGWAEKSRAVFEEATVGPITVYDSSRPFLKWEALGHRSSLILPCQVNLKTQEVRELLPEGHYSRIRTSGNDSFMTYVVTKHLKTTYRERNGREYELFRLDLKEGAKPRSLLKMGTKLLRISWNKEENEAGDGTRFAWADKGDIFLGSAEDGEISNLTKNLSPKNKDGDPGIKRGEMRFSLIRFSPEGTRLLLQSGTDLWLMNYKNREMERAYSFPKNSNTKNSIAAWSPDGRYLYMTHNTTNRWERGFLRYDLQKKHLKDLVKDSNTYGGLTMSADGRKFFYSSSNGDLPSDYYMTDKDFSKPIRLTNLNPWIASRKLTRSELISYLDTDGHRLYGVLYYPVDYVPGKKYPLVCQIYQQFFNNGYNPMMNIITNQGWFGLRPSVHLTAGYPEGWVKGVTAAINTLIERGLVDSSKLGIQGTSFGGFGVSMLITQTDRFAAAINISGKVNSVSFLGDSPRIGTRNYYSAEAGWFAPIGASLWEQRLKYINQSSVMYADRIKTPHLLITGGADWNVPPTNTREMYYALRRLGKECVWVDYHNDGHGIGSAENEAIFQDKWNRIIDWYTSHFDKAGKDRTN